MKPEIIKGGLYSDTRGKLFFNNNFDISVIKRIYFIENNDIYFVRAWQGHKIEQRWFSAIQGSFELKFIKIDDWKNPSKWLIQEVFIISSDTFDVIHLPSGFISSIQSLQDNSKLMVMADYLLGEIKDEYRFDLDYFNK